MEKMEERRDQRSMEEYDWGYCRIKQHHEKEDSWHFILIFNLRGSDELDKTRHHYIILFSN